MGSLRGVALLLAVVTFAVVGFVIWRDRVAEAPPSDPEIATMPAPRQDATAAASGLAPNTVATRVAAEPDQDPELAAAPTAWLRVLDNDTGRPVEGAAVRSAQGGVELGFTDANGVAPLPLGKPQQLAVIADGYLLRLVPAQLDSSAQAPQEARLVVDRFSHRLRLRFSASGAPFAGEVWVQLHRLDRGEAPLAPTGGDAVVQRAWREHAMLLRLPVGRDLGMEDGVPAADRAHRLRGDGEIRFLTAGVYRLAAATTSGLVAQREITIAPALGGRSEVALALEPGGTLRGAVVAADGRALAEATVQVEGGDPLGLVATTGPDGAFALGPLGAGALRLHVHHFDHEPLAFGPVDGAATGVRIVLQPLPASAIRGRVRSRPDLAPIADAVVVWSADGRPPVTVRTDRQGRFTVLATGTGAARLVVQAQGHVPYAELVEPGAAFADYDVLPAVPAVRVEKGMSALLCGAVVDARGQPVVGLPVRWIPDTPPSPQAFPGRRALEGAVLDLPGLTTTGVDGAFALETNSFGGGRLCLPDDVAATSRGLRLEAVAGETRNGLTLRR